MSEPVLFPAASSALPTIEPGIEPGILEPVEPAETLAALVEGCPGVAALSGGSFGEVATYLPGRRVRGIRLDSDLIEVHIVAHWGTPLPALVERLRAVCATVAGTRPIDVYVDDLQVPESLIPQAPSGGT